VKLTRADEVALFQRIKAAGPDGEAALAQFVDANQELVGWVASQYSGRGLTRRVLMSAGNLGLLQAAGKFDPGLDLKFSTMGVVWIRGAITAEFAAVRKRKESDQRILATETGVSLVAEDGSRPGSAEGASVRIAHGDDAAPDVGNAADLAADGAIGHIGFTPCGWQVQPSRQLARFSESRPSAHPRYSSRRSACYAKIRLCNC